MKSKILTTSISSRVTDLSGKTYGRLKVLGFHRMNGGFSMWVCKCSCGREIVSRGLSLKTGHTKSCGCFRKKHGLGSTKTYYSWVEMKRRCTNKTRWEYQKYGAVGIKVCERWMKFSNFLSDMGIKPEGTTLDRIDGKKGYYKKNCRWATSKEQIVNRTITRFVTINGETLCIADMARKYKMHPHIVYQRLGRNWPLDKALTVKPDTRNRLGRNV